MDDIACVRKDLVNRRLNDKICKLYFSDLVKNFNESPIRELYLPSEINKLPEVKQFVCNLADSNGIAVRYDNESQRLILVKELSSLTVESQYKLFELSDLTVRKLLRKVVPSSNTFSHRSQNKAENISHSALSRTLCRGANANYKPSTKLSALDNASLISIFGENPAFLHHRRNLPIYKYRLKILQHIVQDQVTIIMGDSGCGKTTQVPQYILEQTYVQGTPCRIISIQPRSISAIAASDRVVSERGVTGEMLVGHQAQMETRCQNNCHLIFCTTAVFLSTLIEDDDYLEKITHVIVDQIHERDRFTEILLAVLRIRMKDYPHLRLILLSAIDDMVSQNMTVYFQQEEVIGIPSQTVPVTVCYLEDIIASINFHPKEDEKVVRRMIDLDGNILKAWFGGSKEVFSELLQLVHSGSIPIDYQHSETGVTILMAAAVHGHLEIIRSAIILGANPNIKTNGKTSFDFANELGHLEVSAVLQSYSLLFDQDVGTMIRTEPVGAFSGSTSDEKKLEFFYDKYNQEHTNLDLVVKILEFICGYPTPGSILIYLSGFSEAIELRDMITNHPDFQSTIEVHCLTCCITMADYKKLLLPVSKSKKKVILTTSIAETSVSFQDIFCVIDSGLLRDNDNEVVVTGNRKTRWISKASAQRRAQHIKNGGIVYRLYSRSTMEEFADLTIPEILRDPLVDVCLYSGLLIPGTMTLDMLFSLLPNCKPSPVVVKQAITSLKEIDALDIDEKVTAVGRRLIDLPIDPRFTKMVLNAVTLKCLDPVLTIASALACDDPFIVPSSPEDRKNAFLKKYELVAGNYSDHLALLKVYQLWDKTKTGLEKRKLCQENYLSVGSLELISLLRVTLVGALRASNFVHTCGTNEISKLNVHSDCWPVVKACLTTGLSPNIGRYSPLYGNVVIANETPSQLNITSTLLVQEMLGSQTDQEQIRRYPGYNSAIKDCRFNMLTRTPCVIFENQLKTGPLPILHCCSVITPITALLFAASVLEICQPSVNQMNLADMSNEPEDEDHMTEEEIRQLSRELQMEDITDELITMNMSIRQLKAQLRQHKSVVILKASDNFGFLIDTRIAFMMKAIHNDLQDLLWKCIEEPGRQISVSEESVISLVLSALSSEEMAINLRQPSRVGRKPTNVTPESCMSTVPDQNTEHVSLIKQYLTYTSPPKGHGYEKTKASDSTDEELKENKETPPVTTPSVRSDCKRMISGRGEKSVSPRMNKQPTISENPDMSKKDGSKRGIQIRGRSALKNVTNHMDG